MAIWKKCRYDRKSVISTFGGGINRAVDPFHIKDNEILLCSWMDSDKYPAIQTALGESTFKQFTADPFGLGQRNDSILHVVYGKFWEYWDTATTSFVRVSSNMSSGNGAFSELATESVLYTLFVSTAEHLAWDGVSTNNPVDMSTDCPYSPLITTHKGRIYMAKDKTVYFSALLKTTDWITAEDAGNIPITNAKGDITGITEYADHLIIFTKNSMHEIYGDNPKNFSLVDVSNEIGCIRNKTIQEVGGRLLWLDYEGIFTYEGGAHPVNISDKVKDIIAHPPSSWLDGSAFTATQGACAGSYRNKYYLSLPSKDSHDNEVELNYDPKTGIWHRSRRATFTIVDYLTVDDDFYCMDESWAIAKRLDGELDRNSTGFWWSMQTKFYDDGTISEQKTLHSIDIVYRIETTNSAKVVMDIRYSTELFDSPNTANSSSYNILAASSNSTNLTAGVHTLPISTGMHKERIMIPTTALQNLNHYGFFIGGEYPVIIYQLQRNLRIKKDSF